MNATEKIHEDGKGWHWREVEVRAPRKGEVYLLDGVPTEAQSDHPTAFGVSPILELIPESVRIPISFTEAECEALLVHEYRLSNEEAEHRRSADAKIHKALRVERGPGGDLYKAKQARDA